MTSKRSEHRLHLSRAVLGLALVALAAHSAGPAQAAPGDSRPAAHASIPRLDSAKAQLEHAAGLKKAMSGTEGEARDAARKLSIEAYRCVREYFGGDAAACAEAAFRAGELLRAADDMPGAQTEFAIARDRGAGTTFQVRAMMELAHLDRRAKRLEKALDGYESIVSSDAATARQKDDASLWCGRVYADLERPKDARRVWQRVADKGDDPLDRIRAWDLMASLLVDQGDLEGAAGTLERCREALSDVAQEESRLGERVRTALASMRSQDELARAVEKRHAGDADTATDKKKGTKKDDGRGAKKDKERDDGKSDEDDTDDSKQRKKTKKSTDDDARTP
jgi:tetratricopeptide (TPR) repeat protein